jgi:TolB-like protein
VASRSSEASRDAAVAIAVLPFADMSAASDQAYLCEGMAEEIMNALVRVDGIRVASRASAFRAQREGRDVPAIARVLSVGHILDGSVRTSGSRLRVTAQLTDVATGFHRGPSGSTARPRTSSPCRTRSPRGWSMR